MAPIGLPTIEKMSDVLESQAKDSSSVVPCVDRRPGRKIKWTYEIGQRLIKEVRNETQNNGLNITKACEEVARQEPWRSEFRPTSSNRTTADVLREKYQRLWMDRVELFQDTQTGELFARTRQRRKVRREGKYSR